MASNPYDQFSAPIGPPPRPQGNPYDRFDPPAPTAPTMAPAPTQQAESPYSMKNLAGAAIEPVMSILSGAVAAPVSGLAGLAGTAVPGPQGQGAKWAQGTGRALTYEPRSQGGQTALGAISYPFEKIAEGADVAGEGVSRVAGPAAGAGTNAALQLLPQLLLGKGLSKKAPIPGEITAPPNVRVLADKGVTMTPGQIKGGLPGRIEQKAESLPIVGDAIREAKVKGVEGFNRAAIDDALAPVGEKLPAGLKGNAAIEWTADALGAKYEALLPNLSLRPPWRDLVNRLNTVRDAAKDLPEAQLGELNRIIDKEIVKRAKGGEIDGRTLKQIESKLSGLSKTMGRSENYDVRELGLRVKDINAALRETLAEANPQYAAELAKINEGYSKFKIAQRAAGSTAAKEGVFTPTQYHSAVKAKDASKDRARFSEGQANQQELSTAGKSVLQDTVANSGTADRVLLAEILRKPWLLPPAWGASLLYSQPALRGMQQMLMRPPNAGNAMLRALPYGAMQQGQIPQPPQ